jgi:hypothetical protein
MCIVSNLCDAVLQVKLKLATTKHLFDYGQTTQKNKRKTDPPIYIERMSRLFYCDKFVIT